MADGAFLFSVLDRLVAQLEALHAEYMLVGGIALAAWIEARATTDIDIVVALPEDDARALAAHLAQRLDGVASPKAIRFSGGGVLQRLVVGHEAGGVIIDVILADDAVLREALARRCNGELPITQRAAHFATAEDLTVMKLRAWRPKDILDIQQLAAVEGFDAAYVERQAAALGLLDRWRTIQPA